jgi:acyl-CoA synthetase (AMP-forming)/AMP-acid ligase II
MGEMLALEIREFTTKQSCSSSMKDNGLIYEGFLESAHQFPNRPALEVESSVITYSDLRQRVFRLAASLQKHDVSGQPALTAVFGYRSATAYAGLLAALFPDMVRFP